MIFTGDFFQLPPVHRSVTPTTNPNPNPNSVPISQSQYQSQSQLESLPASQMPHRHDPVPLPPPVNMSVPTTITSHSNTDSNTDSAVYKENRFCFQSPIWNQLFPLTCKRSARNGESKIKSSSQSRHCFVLEKVYRQTDEEFSALLNQIRWGVNTGA